MIFGNLEVNLLVINFLIELLCLSTGRVSQPDSQIVEMNLRAALPNLCNSITFNTLLYLTFLALIKLAIHSKEVNMFLELISKKLYMSKDGNRINLLITSIIFRKTIDVVVEGNFKLLQV